MNLACRPRMAFFRNSYIFPNLSRLRGRDGRVRGYQELRREVSGVKRAELECQRERKYFDLLSDDIATTK